LKHTPQRETDYLAAQSGVLGVAMRIIGYVVASIMALGALFAAVNTMYASVEARGIEIATLRALGFSAAPIVMSVLLEGIVLCLSRTRTWLTVLSIVIAFFLFGLLQSVRILFEADVHISNAENLYVSARSGAGQPLPLSYRGRIAAVPGVRFVTPAVPIEAWY